jgi:hypothetical protein
MSALPPKADIKGRDEHVRFVPIADKRTAAKKLLFDHLVGYREHFRRHFDAKRSSCLQVDGGPEIGRLRDRKLGWLLASRMRFASR